MRMVFAYYTAISLGNNLKEFLFLYVLQASQLSHARYIFACDAFLRYMLAVVHHTVAADDDVAYQIVVAGEDPGVE
jgi:hypothetical protein